ncbi:MAG: ribonuclease P protein component [Nitrospiraceae bacterium]|nr:ribonuclease P protein component [Nitrospiraceae bacterium]
MKPVSLTRGEIQRIIESPGIKVVSSAFVLLCQNSSDYRLSVLVGKKIGKAVFRNRVRRRLREAYRLTVGFPPGFYVIMGRNPALTTSFDQLLDQMVQARKTLSRLKA